MQNGVPPAVAWSSTSDAAEVAALPGGRATSRTAPSSGGEDRLAGGEEDVDAEVERAPLARVSSVANASEP